MSFYLIIRKMLNKRKIKKWYFLWYVEISRWSLEEVDCIGWRGRKAELIEG